MLRAWWLVPVVLALSRIGAAEDCAKRAEARRKADQESAELSRQIQALEKSPSRQDSSALSDGVDRKYQVMVLKMRLETSRNVKLHAERQARKQGCRGSSGR